MKEMFEEEGEWKKQKDNANVEHMEKAKGQSTREDQSIAHGSGLPNHRQKMRRQGRQGKQGRQGSASEAVNMTRYTWAQR